MIHPGVSALDCGKTIDEISTYIAADRTPYDPDIETCPECLDAMHALVQVSELSRELVATDAAALPPPPETWLRTIMSNIRSEVRAGRSLPIHHADPRVRITVTEGAVRGLIRSAGDDVDALIVGKCELIGDVDQPGSPVAVRLTASVAWGQPIPRAAAQLRQAVFDLLARHTELTVTSVDVAVESLHGYELRGRAQ